MITGVALNLAARRPFGTCCAVVANRVSMCARPPILFGVSTTSGGIGDDTKFISPHPSEKLNCLSISSKRFVSTSRPLLFPADGDSTNEGSGGKDGDEKTQMIQRWMKWNTSKTFKYKPDLDLIAKIGKEGSKSPLDAFRDTVPREKRVSEPVGRSWTVKELRRKSYEDLHKLWYVLYKERNMLMTETNLARRHSYYMVQPERRKKVRKSMGAIKHVLGERKRKKIADWKEYLEVVEDIENSVANKMDFHSDEMENAMHDEAEGLKEESILEKEKN